MLEVTIAREKDLSGSYTIGPRGTIAMPLIGEVEVVGLQVAEAAAKLESLYRDGYLVRPEVKVTVAEYKSQVVVVVGKVDRPGTVPWHEGMTALEAVLAAGNFSEFASRNKTRVVRGEGKGRRTIVVRLGDVVQKGETGKDLALEPGDYVVVPESLF